MFFTFGSGGEAWGRGVRKVKNTFSALQCTWLTVYMGKQLFSKLNIVELEISRFTKMYDTICGQIYLVNIAFLYSKNVVLLTEKF